VLFRLYLEIVLTDDKKYYQVDMKPLVSGSGEHDRWLLDS